MSTRSLLAAVLAAPILLGGCGGRNADAPGGGPNPEAEKMFKLRCSPCHGPDGHGNGTASATLNPKPRNYHDKAWQAKVTDEQIERTILYGGAAVGKSPAMPANPDLQEKPELIKALRAKVRSFGKD